VVIDGMATMDAIVSRAVAPWRFNAWMFTVFAALALMLATVGLFSLVSLDVAQRRREFAVRLALGAREEISFGRSLSWPANGRLLESEA
jgi:putative ABC transport system permease protein